MSEVSRLFKISVANYANDPRYRRAQSGYLIILLVVIAAVWPGPWETAEGASLDQIIFFARTLLPLVFPLMQLRFGFGLRDPAETEPPERIPIPRDAPGIAGVMLAELLHCFSLWTLQSPLLIAAVSAAGFMLEEVLEFLLILLGTGTAARVIGVLGRVLMRGRHHADHTPGSSTPESPVPESSNTY
ncbi:MAG: hypothetical protein ACLFUM_09210 [Spirochaetaceae bacterium]